MSRRITADEARAFRDRWRLVNEREIAEMRATPPAEKFRQLANLVESAKALGWTRDEAAETEVWERWALLRERLGARS